MKNTGKTETETMRDLYARTFEIMDLKKELVTIKKTHRTKLNRLMLLQKEEEEYHNRAKVKK